MAAFMSDVNEQSEFETSVNYAITNVRERFMAGAGFGWGRKDAVDAILAAHRAEIVRILKGLKHPWGDDDSVDLVPTAEIDALIAKYGGKNA